MSVDLYCHATSILVERPAIEAFRYMADGIKQGEWTFGSWDREQIGPDLFRGTSLFDGATTHVRIRPDESNLVVYYDLGDSQGEMVPQNMSRIVRGPDVGLGADVCIVTLLAWRKNAMPDERWRQLCVSHETEMFIIKNRIEAGGGRS